MIAAALLDDTVGPEQYLPDRILKPDVQTLLRKITIRPDEAYRRLLSYALPCRIMARLKRGKILMKEKADYESFFGSSAESVIDFRFR